MHALTLPVATGDGHRAELIARIPAHPTSRLLWLPAMGVAARHYLPLAEALAARGVAVFLHEWRGNGASNWRAGRGSDWGYRELLADIAASARAVAHAAPGIPQRLGGHSLGGQLAACHLGLHPDAASELWLVASGSPYWRSFRTPMRYLLPLACRLLPWIARRIGWLPGRRLKFAGNEARGVITEWARSGLRGNYRVAGVDADLDAGMQRYTGGVVVVTCTRDWLCPASSARYLAAKLGNASRRDTSLDARALGARPDHFAWMRSPAAVVDALLPPAPG